MKLAVVVSLACVIGAAPGVVRAQCEAPRVGFSPSAGNLPPRSTIYVFVPTFDAGGTITSSQARLIVDRVAVSPAFHVYKVVVAASSGTVTVRYQPRRAELSPSEASYRIGGEPQPNTARVTDVGHLQRVWGCSHTNTIQLAVAGTAIAYRVDWDSTHTTILPASDPQLGHLNCTGDNVEPSELEELRSFELVALFADGSEMHVGSAKARLGLDGVRLPTELTGRRPTVRVALEPKVEVEVEVEVEEKESPLALLAGLAGLGALVIASGFAWRRARTHP